MFVIISLLSLCSNHSNSRHWLEGLVMGWDTSVKVSHTPKIIL